MPSDNLCFLDWIKILTLEILLCADREQLGITDLTHDHGHQVS